jgi:sugar phosphate permease
VTGFKSSYRRAQPFFVWGLAAFFFLMVFLIRVNLGVILLNLAGRVQGPVVLGGLSAVFYYAYFLMQLPAGILVDRYGPYHWLVVSSLLCGLACFSFALFEGVASAILSQFVIGLFGAFAFIATIRLSITWFSRRALPLLIGLAHCFALGGGIIGKAGISHYFSAAHWQDTLLWIGLVLVLLSFLIMLFVRDRKPTLLSARDIGFNQVPIMDAVMIVLRNPYSWAVSLYVALMYAPIAILCEFWGSAFLHWVYQVPFAAARELTVLILLGLLLGSLCFPVGVMLFKQRRFWLIGSALSSLLLLLIILYCPLSTLALRGLLFCFGFAAGGINVAYLVAVELNAFAVSGIAIAVVNMMSLLVLVLMQPLVAWLVTRYMHWHLSQVALDSPLLHQSALIGLPIALCLALLLSLLIKETGDVKA